MEAEPLTRSAETQIDRSRPSGGTRIFIRHYVEMVLAMTLGMGAYGLVLVIAGVDIGAQSDEARLLWMAVAMTVPMVAWMRYRGHRWVPTWEMAAAMVAPALLAVVLLRTGVTDDFDALMALEHVAMFAGMLAVMLVRREEYSRPH